jgi:hypothetical protein
MFHPYEEQVKFPGRKIFKTASPLTKEVNNLPLSRREISKLSIIFYSRRELTSS